MEDDAEEMSQLRKMRNRHYRRQPFPNASDNEQETVTILKSVPENKIPEQLDLADDTVPDKDMASMMGFASFGKKARTFDFNALFEQTRRAAKEKFEGTQNSSETPEPTVSQSSDKKESESSSGSSDSSDSEDEVIGPPIPQDILNMINSPQEVIKDQNDSDEEEEGEKVGWNDRYKTVPASHEVVLQHGDKTVSAMTLDPNGAQLITGTVLA